MKIGPKYKIARRLGAFVFEKTQTPKFALVETRTGKKGRFPRTRSEFGRQLIERQRTRFTYGITAGQLDNYAKKASQTKGGTPVGALFRLLERRLDNTLYRMGIASTRRLARQMVSHGHIVVNGKKVNVPSFVVSEGDKISVRLGSQKSLLFENLEEKLKDRMLPSWVSLDPKTYEGRVVSLPEMQQENLPYDLSSVIESAGR